MSQEYDLLGSYAGDSAISSVLEEHPEVRILWERRKNIAGPIDINGQNPILHVLFESIAENQIRQGDPPEAGETYVRLQGLGLSPHAARGAIANLLVDYLFDVLKHKAVFDTAKYVRHLRLLGTKVEQVGRNQPCPCGSGKKFKKCCLLFADSLEVNNSMGTLVLGGGHYATPGYLLEQPPGAKIISMENRAHIAEFFEEQGDIEGAAACLRENVNVAEKYMQDMLENALQDLQLLCMNHPELSVLGLETTQRLIDLAEGEQKGQYRCDKADILVAMGRFSEAEEEFRALFNDMPGYHFGRYRYALHLMDAGRVNEAKSVLQALLAHSDELDENTRHAASAVLADMDIEN